MKIELRDPTFTTLQREPPSPKTTGIILSETDAVNYLYSVSFNGQTITCRSAGKRTLAAGDRVSFVENRPYPWIIKSDALYPTRYKKPLADWSSSKPANVFLEYMLKDNPKWFTYRSGTITAIVDTTHVSALCWDNIIRNFPVEYPGETCNTSGFVAGDPCLIYRKSENNLVVIGKFMEPADIILRRFGMYGMYQNWDGKISGVYGPDNEGDETPGAVILNHDLTIYTKIEGSYGPPPSGGFSTSSIVYISGSFVISKDTISGDVYWSTDLGSTWTSWASIVTPTDGVKQNCDVTMIAGVGYITFSELAIVPESDPPEAYLIFYKYSLPGLTLQWSYNPTLTTESSHIAVHPRNGNDVLFQHIADQAEFYSGKSFDPDFPPDYYYTPVESAPNTDNHWVKTGKLWLANSGLAVANAEITSDKCIRLNDGTFRLLYGGMGGTCTKYDGVSFTNVSFPEPYKYITDIGYTANSIAIDSTGATYYAFLEGHPEGGEFIIRFPASLNV